MKIKCISITEEHEETIKNQSQRFNLSKFVRAKLDEYFSQKNKMEEANEKIE